MRHPALLVASVALFFATACGESAPTAPPPPPVAPSAPTATVPPVAGGSAGDASALVCCIDMKDRGSPRGGVLGAKGSCTGDEAATYDAITKTAGTACNEPAGPAAAPALACCVAVGESTGTVSSDCASGPLHSTFTAAKIVQGEACSIKDDTTAKPVVRTSVHEVQTRPGTGTRVVPPGTTKTRPR